MANSPSSPGENFDLRKIRRLAELMNEYDLGEVDLRDAGLRIRLRKRSESPGGVEPRAYAPAPAGVSASTASGAPAAEAHLTVIKSIMVGTFYAAVNPEAPPFVKVGDHVGVETTVCILEAMKVMNEIQAGVSGQIVAVLVQNGEPVEYGQPLFKVDPSK